MPLLSGLARRFTADRPFDGMSIAACLHVTAETAVLARALQAGGARVALAASNPLSTQDDIAAALSGIDGMAVYARAGVDRAAYYQHINLALDTRAPISSWTTAATSIQTLHTERLASSRTSAADASQRAPGCSGCAGWRPRARSPSR